MADTLKYWKNSGLRSHLLGLRKASKKTVIQVAKEIKEDPSQVALWEDGAEEPSLERLVVWATVFNHRLMLVDFDTGKAKKV